MSGEGKLKPDSGAYLSPRPWDSLIAELADFQHGVVGHSQLLALGMGRRAIGHRLERRRLHSVQRGVYAVGRRRSAAAFWGLRRGDPARTEVTVPRRVGVRAGIRAHRAGLLPDEITVVDGIPVTTVARTIFDFAAVADRHEVERAMEQAEARRLADHTPLKEILGQESRVAGITRSELEDRFLRFLSERALPAPRTNVWLQIGGDPVKGDCIWSDHRVVVELGLLVPPQQQGVAGWEPIASLPGTRQGP